MNAYTLNYRTQDGEQIVLFNLDEWDVYDIVTRQRAYGASDFIALLQPRQYNEAEMQRLREQEKRDTRRTA